VVAHIFTAFNAIFLSFSLFTKHTLAYGAAIITAILCSLRFQTLQHGLDEEVVWQRLKSFVRNCKRFSTQWTVNLTSWYFILSVLNKALEAERVKTWQAFGYLQSFQAD